MTLLRVSSKSLHFKNSFKTLRISPVVILISLLTFTSCEIQSQSVKSKFKDTLANSLNSVKEVENSLDSIRPEKLVSESDHALRNDSFTTPDRIGNDGGGGSGHNLPLPVHPSDPSGQIRDEIDPNLPVGRSDGVLSPNRDERHPGLLSPEIYPVS